VQVQGAVGAVRGEVDPVTEPHREAVCPPPVGDPFEVSMTQGTHPDVLRGSALVALPGPVLAGDAVVGDPGAVRRVAGEPCAVHRELDRHSPIHRDRVEHLRGSGVLAPAAEEHALARGIPAEHAVLRGVEGQPPRHAATCGDHVHVGSAVVARCEGDLGAVRTELGVPFGPRVAGDPARVAPGRSDEPQVVLVGEDDHLAVDVGPAHEVGLVGRGCCRDDTHDGQDEGQVLHVALPSPLQSASGGRRRLTTIIDPAPDGEPPLAQRVRRCRAGAGVSSESKLSSRQWDGGDGARPGELPIGGTCHLRCYEARGSSGWYNHMPHNFEGGNPREAPRE